LLLALSIALESVTTSSPIAAPLPAGHLVGYLASGTSYDVVTVDPLMGQSTTLVSGSELPSLFSGTGLRVDASGDLIFSGRYSPGGTVRGSAIYRYDPDLDSLSLITDAVRDPRDLDLLTNGQIVVQSGVLNGPLVIDALSGDQILSLYDPIVGNTVWLGVDHVSDAVYSENTVQQLVYRLGPAALAFSASMVGPDFRPTGIAVDAAGRLFIGSEALNGPPQIVRFDPLTQNWIVFAQGGLLGQVRTLQLANDGALLASVAIDATGVRQIVRIDPVTRSQSIVAPGFGSAYFAVVPVPEPAVAALAFVGILIAAFARLCGATAAH
jgi:hypothetical protein